LGIFGIELKKAWFRYMIINKHNCKDHEYIVDLFSVEGDGSFACPKCGVTISPEDKTEENYRIVNTKVITDQVVELVVNWGKCGITMVLTGF
jgi:hypothetical protein